MAKQTVSTFPILTLFCEKSPIYRNSSWVSRNRSVHTPSKQDEEDEKDNEEDDVGSRFESEHVLTNKDVAVEDDEADDPDKVGIAESPTIHLLNDY